MRLLLPRFRNIRDTYHDFPVAPSARRAGWLVSRHALIRTTLALVATGAAIFTAAGSLHAANRFWITASGGVFGTNANWSTAAGGAGGASAPVAADVANFTRASIYTVTFGANVTNLGLLVNNDNVTFDLNGNVYTSTASTAIGSSNAQTGRLTLRNGTLAVDSALDEIFVGSIGSTGFLTVSTGGRIGNGTVDPNLIIGNGGTATLRIEDNGFADLGYLSIGQSTANAAGTVTVAGPNAVLNTSSGILVGRVGTGALNIEGAGTVAAIGASTIGDELGANGTAKVSGIGSSWTQTGALVVANAGDASVTVEAAGLLNTLAAVTIGNGATGIGSGIVTGADSRWNMSGPLSLGVDGLGNMVVSTGGRANTAGAVQMSVNAGSESNAVVTGAGSRWTTLEFTVGSRGKADLTISAGGAIDTTGNVTFGTFNTAVSTAKLTGDNSTWNISGGLNIAALGSATLSVETNSLLNVTGAVALGNPAGPQIGTLNLTGGTITAGSFSRAAGATLNWTSGTLLVNGGTFKNAGENLVLNGSGLDDLPALRLSSGASSVAGDLPSLTIGSSRKGAVVVSGGSNIQLTTASIGSLDGGSGSLVVEGFNSQFYATGDLGVGGSTVAAGGLGNVTIGLGGTVRTDSTLRLWSGGNITLSGGTLRFNTLATNGGKFTFNAGTIQANAALNANAAALDAIVGSTRVLGFGRKIDSLGNAFNAQSDLNVTGGAVAGGVLNVSSGVIMRFEAAGTGTFTGGVVNASGARIYVTDATLAAGTTLTNSGEILLAGTAATINGTGLTNTGLVSGSGRVNSVITNNIAGQVRVAAGQRLEILGSSGANVNNGLVDVDGGTIEFGRAVTNSNSSPSTGLIAARDATLRFQGGLSNSGALDVFGWRLRCLRRRQQSQQSRHSGSDRGHRRCTGQLLRRRREYRFDPGQCGRLAPKYGGLPGQPLRKRCERWWPCVH